MGSLVYGAVLGVSLARLLEKARPPLLHGQRHA
jgi:hypothetical protein